MTSFIRCDFCGKEIPPAEGMADARAQWTIAGPINSRVDLCSWECLHDHVGKYTREGRDK